ncbi:MAG: RHS repeat-associated core domain-containing protein, partial [Symploca sp. SIO2G7]|nr:RHS repeat-associated core domain-containing protein [Symploca sp. SIO2G7]
RLIFKDLPGDEFDVAFTYTDNGLRETVTDGRGTTTYSYDERDRLLQRIDPDGRSIAYTYDEAGNRTSVVIPSGSTAYTFDEQNRLKTVTDPDGGVTTYTYNAVGNLIRTDFANGTVEIREYDELNRLVYLENSGADGVINSFRYTLDETGNRTAVEEHDGRRVEYSYDELYRLTQEAIFAPGATEATRTTQYAYDEVGNRLSREDSEEGVTLYTYDDNDRLLTATTDGVETSHAYDDNGNTVSKTTGSETVNYQWNAENRLIAADTDGDGTVDVTNQYDANGIRVSQTVNGEETQFLIDGNRPYAQVVEEYTPGGVITVSYVHGHDLISQDRDGEQSFYHVDGLGSTRALSEGDGVVSDRYIYDAFGQVLTRVGDTDNSYLFAGEQRDGNLGLDYLRARYLDTGNGRFVSVDPFSGLLTIPVSLHRYLYANVNPANATDPSGLFPNVTGFIVALGIGATLTGIQQLSGRRFLKSGKTEWTGSLHSIDFQNGPISGFIGGPYRSSSLLLKIESDEYKVEYLIAGLGLGIGINLFQEYEPNPSYGNQSQVPTPNYINWSVTLESPSILDDLFNGKVFEGTAFWLSSAVGIGDALVGKLKLFSGFGQSTSIKSKFGLALSAGFAVGVSAAMKVEKK